MVNRKVDFSTQQAIERLRGMSLSDLKAQNRPQSESYKTKLKLYNNLLYGARSAYVQIMCDRIKAEFLNSAEPLELTIQGYEDPTPDPKLYRDRQTNKWRRKLFVYESGRRVHHVDGVDYPIEVRAYTFIQAGTANRRVRGAREDEFENVEIKEFELRWLWEYPLKKQLKEDFKLKFLEGNHAKELLGTAYGFSQSVLGKTPNPNTEADLKRLINHLLDYFVECFGEDEVWAPAKPGERARRVPLLLYAGTIQSIPEGRGAKIKKRNAMRASLVYMQEQEDNNFRSYAKNKGDESYTLPLKAGDTYRGRTWDEDPYAGMDDDPGMYGDYGDDLSHLNDLEHEAYLETGGFYHESPDLSESLSRLRQLGRTAADSSPEHPTEWVEGYQPTAQQQRRQQATSADLEAQADALLAQADASNGTNGKGKKGKTKPQSNGKGEAEPVLTGTRLFTNPADAL